VRRKPRHLSVKIEKQLRMIGAEQSGIEIQMAPDTCIGALHQVPECAHSRLDALRMGDVQPRVKSKPRFRRPVTILATHTPGDHRALDESRRWHRLLRRMAHRAVHRLHWFGNTERLADESRPRACQCCVRAGMKILCANKALILSNAAPVAARGCARRIAREARQIRSPQREDGE
jgi:hypothetical protein